MITSTIEASSIGKCIDHQKRFCGLFLCVCLAYDITADVVPWAIQYIHYIIALILFPLTDSPSQIKAACLRDIRM